VAASDEEGVVQVVYPSEPGHTHHGGAGPDPGSGSTAYLSIGTNLGDRHANLQRALAGLSTGGADVRRVSSIYNTEPVGYTDQPWYLNIAAEVETDLPPLDLLCLCRRIEEAAGRTRPFPDAPRVIDLDILLYADMIVDEPELQIPHPRMVERKFVLLPLVEIAPGLIHPVLKQSMRALLLSCPDRSVVIPVATGGPC
jgi:2-amino-4-hydroxy-6-hydroxymethyldihydropteridine diphosphokinase